MFQPRVCVGAANPESQSRIRYLARGLRKSASAWRKRMKIVSTIEEVRAQVRAWKTEGNTIGFVPTMGYLHEGHLSLIDAAGENDHVVVSIFVNPMQFGPNEDLASYPRDLERDAALCKKHNVDLIFHPTPEEMYGESFYSYVDMDVLTKELCGLSRPVHFRGVCTVVAKLFNIVLPDKAYFGQKDAQQLAIIKRMVKDLNMPLTVTGCPIVREKDGLAKSSRNTYLSPEERKAALVLSRSVFLGKAMAEQGETNAEKIKEAMTAEIKSEPLARIDYVKIVDLKTMQQVKTIQGGVLAAIAVYIGKTRLIDNFMTDENEGK
jgi:pantoate--beta-alanine ligase